MTTDSKFKLICENCKTEYQLFPKTYFCENCGSLLKYKMTVRPEVIQVFFKKIKEKPHRQFWDYKMLLPPIESKYIVSLGEGGTPLLQAKMLGEEIGLEKLYLKDESRNPTQSFRDRAATLIVSVAKKLKVNKIICSSNGNMAAAVSAYASKAHIRATAILPENVDLGKLAQIHMYGCKVITYGKTVDDAIKYELENFSPEKYYHATPELNSLSIEGQKTIAFEIFERLGEIDFLIVPTGSGSLAYALWVGFEQLYNNELISNLPKIVVVQPVSCAPIIWRLTNREFKSENIQFVKGIYVKDPRYINEAIKAVKTTQGLGIAVDEKEIIEHEKILAKLEGIFSEPSSAASIAGVRKLVDGGVVDKKDKIVAVLTSSGLKTPYIIKALTERKKMAVISKTLNTKVKILKFLEYGPSYGYEIWKQLFPMLKIQAVYQHLSELEDRGLIKSSQKERRNYYEITNKGKKVIQAFDELALLL